MTPNKKELGLTFKREAKQVAEALEALGEEDAMCLKVRRRVCVCVCVCVCLFVCVCACVDCFGQVHACPCACERV